MFVAALSILLFGVLGASVVEASPTQRTPDGIRTKRALLIGIDKYKARTVRDLDGAVNDVELMKSLLIGKFAFLPENVHDLKNAAANRKAILDAIRTRLIEASDGDDIAILHFSGHGSQMTDQSGDEGYDQLDETIVPWDSRQGGVFDITDDELNDLLDELSLRTSSTVFILDSCHSGSGARAPGVREIEPDTRTPPPLLTSAIGARSLAEGPDDFSRPSSKYVLLSACKANELAKEFYVDGKDYGVMTHGLAQALLGAVGPVTYRYLVEEVNAVVNARFVRQHPQIEGSQIDSVVFTDQVSIPRTTVLVEPDKSKKGFAIVSAGTFHGVAAGTKLTVYPANTTVFDGSVPPIATIVISVPGTFSSKATIKNGKLSPHARAVLDQLRRSDFSILVSLNGIAANIAKAVRSKLSDYEAVHFAAAGVGRTPDIEVVKVGDAIRLKGRSGEMLKEISSAGDVAGSLSREIANWGKWFAILSMSNPAPNLNVELSIRFRGGTDAKRAPEVIPAGTPLTISVTNRSTQPVNIILLDLASNGDVEVLFPPNEIPDPIAPGDRAIVDVKSSVPDDREIAIDHLKAIMTTEFVSPSIFRLEPVGRGAAPASRSGESDLQYFIRSFAQGLTRNPPLVEVQGWTVGNAILRVDRSETRISSYAMHFATEEEGMRAATARIPAAGSRALCDGPSATDCYDARTLPGDASTVELRMSESRDTDSKVGSIGQAFEESYRIRNATNALRVEPLFDEQLPENQRAPAGDPGTGRGGGSEKPDPRAEEDDRWSLKYTRVPEAWAAVRAVSGSAPGKEAEGVVIAHADTGYLRHPEIWTAPLGRPLFAENGYDYYASDDDASDDLLDTRLLDNPAHGTGSGSAIISPEGCQTPDAVKCPTGIARGAQLVPVRVNRSVVNLSTRRLAVAILEASGDDRTKIKAKSDVMSVAMGGPPSWTLWKAVQKAETRGYLIVAAAGNYVGEVIWPARFPSVVGVAAVNAGCKPWRFSSLGPAVAFSAPGESVWRATIDENGKFITGMGSGTTYATSTTAGIAALWIAKHRNSAAFQQLVKYGKVASAFRDLASQTAWQPGTARVPAGVACDQNARWNPDLLGTGIIDAAALLAAPLPQPQANRGRDVASVTELPLWKSLYAATATDAAATADFRHLFRDRETETDVGIFEAEILHHFANSERVATAVDEIVIRSNRDDATFEHVRSELRAQDLSLTLRQALH